MTRRQSVPRQWLIVDRPTGDASWRAIRRLPLESGVLLLRPAGPVRLRLRTIAVRRSLTVVEEANGLAVRVHDVDELRRALLARTPFIFLSPIYPTLSHPERRSLPRIRAATLARLADRRLIALGGMDARRFGRVQRLGFIGWAGIRAWL